MIQFVGWPDSANQTLSALKDHPLRTEFDRLWSVSIREFLAQRQHWSTLSNVPTVESAKQTTLATFTALLTSELRARLKVASQPIPILARLQADLHVESIRITPTYRPVTSLRVNMPETGLAFDITEQGSPKDP